MITATTVQPVPARIYISFPVTNYAIYYPNAQNNNYNNYASGVTLTIAEARQLIEQIQNSIAEAEKLQ